MTENVTVLSLLTEARDAVERMAAETQQLWIRFRVAYVIRELGHEANFGSYVADAFAAREASIRERSPPNPVRQAEREELQSLETEARQLFVSGDLSRAEQVFQSGDPLRDDHMRHGVLGARLQFLQWALQAGEPGRARDLVISVDWENPVSRIAAARQVSEAYIAEGRRDDAVAFLRSFWPSPDMPAADLTLCRLADALWGLGAIDEAIQALRAASVASLAGVAANVRRPFGGYGSSEPLAIARTQLAMGDKGGAIETLRGVQRFEALVEYEPPPAQSALNPSRGGGTKKIVVISQRLKPAAQRWLNSRRELARLLSRAGLEHEAFALLDIADGRRWAIGEADYDEILASIIRGLAERGAFEAAFRTLDQLLEDRPPAEVLHWGLDSDPVTRSLAGRAETGPLPLDEKKLRQARTQAAHIIAWNAARLGHGGAFKRAAAYYRQIAPDDWENRILEGQMLRFLARSGQIETALEFAETNHRRRVEALLSVAEGIAGMPDRNENSLWP